jgi:hypothetical protein
MNPHFSVISWPQGNPHSAINDHRQNKTIVVISMFADEVDSTGGVDGVRRPFAKPLFKIRSYPLL